MRTLISAPATYAATCGRGGFAEGVAGLTTAPPAGERSMPPDFGLARKSGYVFRLNGNGGMVPPAAQTCNRAIQSMGVGFANPQPPGTTGDRRFGVSENGLIRFDPDATSGTVTSSTGRGASTSGALARARLQSQP